MIISSGSLVDAEEALAAIKHSAERSAFRLNHEKEEGPASKITAFNIDLSAKCIYIEPERIKAFSEAFANATNKYQQLGILGYITSVNAEQAKEISSCR